MLCADDIAELVPLCYQERGVCYFTERKSLDLSGARAFCGDLSQTWDIQITLPLVHNYALKEAIQEYRSDETLDRFWIDAESQQLPPTAPWIWIDVSTTVDPSSLYYVPFYQRCKLRKPRIS